MTRGLHAPLSPQEEIALRRIAHGSIAVEAQAMDRLLTLALVECAHGTLRLTPLGRLRFDALPKAPLLKRKRSAQAGSDYVVGIIEKAHGVSKRQVPKAAPAPPASEESAPQASAADDNVTDDVLHKFVESFADLAHWKSRAESNIEKTRRSMIEHRQHQERQCDNSRRRIEISRSLLAATVPVTPAWLDALQVPGS